MNRSGKFRKWLEKNYPYKQPREAFLTEYNAIAQALGAEPVKWPPVEHWMYDRQPPTHVGPVTFERALELILERRENPSAATRIYTIALPVDGTTEKAIERRAWMSGVPPEEWLRATLDVALTKLPK